MDIRRVLIVGAGLMGGGIAQVAALAGYRVADLIYELRRRGGRYGLETMCVGGGQGFALLVEAV